MVVVSRAPLCEAGRLPGSHGLDLQVGVVGRFRLQLRLSGLVHPEEMAAKRALYNFTIRDPLAPEREGHSIFYKDEAGAIFHTYSCYDRGNDKLNLHYHYLDLVAEGPRRRRARALLGAAPRRSIRSLGRRREARCPNFRKSGGAPRSRSVPDAHALRERRRSRAPTCERRSRGGSARG